MRWLACCLLLVGCVRARGTLVHATEHERTSGASGSTIARTLPATDEVSPPAGNNPSNLASLELGAVVPFPLETAHVHLAPGVRIFGSGEILYGVAVGADFLGTRGGPGFALEGSVHAGNSGPDPFLIVQAVDLFAGVTLHGNQAPVAVAIGPSVGIIGMPAGHSVYTMGLALRITTRDWTRSLRSSPDQRDQ
jgi:hypothetical protein